MWSFVPSKPASSMARLNYQHCKVGDFRDADGYMGDGIWGLRRLRRRLERLQYLSTYSHPNCQSSCVTPKQLRVSSWHVIIGTKLGLVPPSSLPGRPTNAHILPV